MNSKLTIMFALAGFLLLQSCGKETSFTAVSPDQASQSISKSTEVVTINNEIDLTVRMASCGEFQLTCVQMAAKYKRTLDIAQMSPEQSVFVEQGDIFIYSSGGNKNLKKLDQSLNAGMVHTCGIDIHDAYARSGMNVYIRANINVVHSSGVFYHHETNFQSVVGIQP